MAKEELYSPSQNLKVYQDPIKFSQDFKVS